MGGAINKGVSEGSWSRDDLVVTAKNFSGIKGFRKGSPNSPLPLHFCRVVKIGAQNQ
ncbi:hypothetical protein PI124_g8841 [Phytophthora idaei]|nr:hypothetical protein PI125_g8451 [Phytophthora idaei]KAG3163447.1 hypothetical protein PI126_g5543 [Phytophthora idaei]KAG3246432.1 hypothetical protein PI124_g8841 [Phytophthora idaei]